jgi:STE24 endopeptidase
MSNGLRIAGILIAVLFLALETPAFAQAPPSAAPTVDVQVQALPALNTVAGFDPIRATEAYLWRVSGSERLRSDTYFEGRYWLSLVRVLYALIVAGGLLWLGVSAAMRDLAARLTRRRFWRTPIYIVQYILLMTVLTFPLAVYEGFAREQLFELSNQSFIEWLGDFGLRTVLYLVLGTVLLTILYWVVRKAKKFWWLYGAGVSIIFLVIALAVTPNIIAPIFYSYSPLPDGKLKSDIEVMARANGLDASRISVINVSDRNKRLSAAVLGFGSHARIVVSDNLLKQGTPAEIKTAIAQEIGHAAMNHTFWGVVLFSLAIFAGFAFWHYGFLLLAAMYGSIWDIRRQDDPAGLPLFVALATLFFLFVSPFTNWITRSQDQRADAFALDAAREPDAMATLVLKQSPYMKLEPGEIEEVLFYNQPTGRSRIGHAMRWKQVHLADPDIANGPISPQ